MTFILNKTVRGPSFAFHKHSSTAPPSQHHPSYYQLLQIRMSRRPLTETEQQNLLRKVIRSNNRNSGFTLRPPARMIAAMEAETANAKPKESPTRLPTRSSVPSNPKSSPVQQLQEPDGPAVNSIAAEQRSVSADSNHLASPSDLSPGYSREDMERWKAEKPVFSFEGPMPKWIEEALFKLGPAGEEYAGQIEDGPNKT
jgi:hypothetical protein